MDDFKEKYRSEKCFIVVSELSKKETDTVIFWLKDLISVCRDPLSGLLDALSSEIQGLKTSEISPTCFMECLSVIPRRIMAMKYSHTLYAADVYNLAILLSAFSNANKGLTMELDIKIPDKVFQKVLDQTDDINTAFDSAEIYDHFLRMEMVGTGFFKSKSREYVARQDMRNGVQYLNVVESFILSSSLESYSKDLEQGKVNCLESVSDFLNNSLESELSFLVKPKQEILLKDFFTYIAKDLAESNSQMFLEMLDLPDIELRECVRTMFSEFIGDRDRRLILDSCNGVVSGKVN